MNILEREIAELENKVINWINQIVVDVVEDRENCPELASKPLGVDIAEDILQNFKDFEFCQIDTLQLLSKKLVDYYYNEMFKKVAELTNQVKELNAVLEARK